MIETLDIDSVQFSWCDRITDVAAPAWNSCFKKGDTFNSHQFFAVLERSQLPGVRFRYLVGESDGELCVAAPCYLFSSPLDLLAPALVRQVVSTVRSILPRFLLLQALIIGNPLAISGDSLGFYRFECDFWEALFRQMKPTLLQEALRLKAHVLVLKEVNSKLVEKLRPALEPDFATVPSMPASDLTFNSATKYTERLRAQYRSLRKRRMATADGFGIVWDVLDNPAHEAEAFVPLYRQVLARSNTKFEELTVEFFREVAALPAVSALAGRFDSKIVAFALIVDTADGCAPIYIGFDYELRDQASLYHNIFYRSIDEAEKRGHKKISLGQTAYESKASLGADFKPLFLAIRAMTPGVKGAFRLFGKAMFPQTVLLQRNVFKSANASSDVD